MINRLFFTVFLVCILITSAPAQQPVATPDDDVVKITTKLVQLDVVVTDKNGRPVRDLTAADFVLLQDGRPQKITAFSYVPVYSPYIENTPGGAKPGEKGAIAAPPARVTPGPAGRIIAIMVDDGACGASLWGINSAKAALTKFINEQMLPTDLVAIYRTRAGSSVLQQYTSDKSILLKAASKIRWLPGNAGCGLADGSFNEAARANTFTKVTPNGTETVKIESDAERKIRENREDMARNNQVVGTIGVLRYALKGLERAPGRKIMLFLSDGLEFRTRQNETLNAREAMRDVTDAANRAGVVVHTFSLRGASVPGMIEARDEVLVRDEFNATDSVSKGRMADELRGHEGLATLAHDTGGSFYRGAARPDRPMGDILRRETGYYLLAYEPGDDSFKGRRFNKIEVKLNVPEMNVAYRSGFTGVPDESVKPKQRTGDSELYEAIASPLPRPGLGLRLSAWFTNTAEGGNFVRSLLFIEGGDIAFTDEPSGQKRAVFDVVAVTMNEKNDVVDEFTRAHTLKLDARTADLIKQSGLVYAADIPVKKSGTYNFRMAVRDGSSRMIGSASQAVEVPDVKKTGLFVSGVTVTGVDEQGRFSMPGASTAQNALSLPASTAVSAIRRFRRGSVIAYAYTVFGARVDPSTNRPRLTAEINLYKDGNLIQQGQPQPVEIQGQTDPSRINEFAYMRLTQIEPGDYVLQITVRDLAAGRNAVSSQWVDFEVVD